MTVTCGYAAPPPPLAGAPGCFSKADNLSAPYRVFQLANVPDAREATSPYWPATDFLTAKPPVVQDPHIRAHLLLWVNRCQYLNGLTASDAQCRVRRRANGDAVVTEKGNSYIGKENQRVLSDQMRSAFSSYAAADACSIAQAMEAIGASDAAVDARARAGNINVYRGPDRTTATMARFTRSVTLADGRPWRYLVNVCVLPPKAYARLFAGLALDFEVNDNRTPTQTTALISEYARLAHAAGKSLYITTNPLPRAASGIDQSNLRSLLASVDYFAVTLSNGASPGDENVGNRRLEATGSILDSYRSQLALLTGGDRNPLTPDLKRKIIWQMPLYQVSLQEAAALQANVRGGGFGGVALFRNYMKQGGTCARDVNQITACVTLGQCSGSFGAARR